MCAIPPGQLLGCSWPGWFFLPAVGLRFCCAQLGQHDSGYNGGGFPRRASEAWAVSRLARPRPGSAWRPSAGGRGAIACPLVEFCPAWPHFLHAAAVLQHREHGRWRTHRGAVPHPCLAGTMGFCCWRNYWSPCCGDVTNPWAFDELWGHLMFFMDEGDDVLESRPGHLYSASTGTFAPNRPAESLRLIRHLCLPRHPAGAHRAAGYTSTPVCLRPALYAECWVFGGNSWRRNGCGAESEAIAWPRARGHGRGGIFMIFPDLCSASRLSAPSNLSRPLTPSGRPWSMYSPGGRIRQHLYHCSRWLCCADS